MAIIEFLLAIGDLLISWRFYLCIFVTVGCAIKLHEMFPDRGWVYFITIPLVLVGILGSFIWQIKSDEKNNN